MLKVLKFLKLKYSILTVSTRPYMAKNIYVMHKSSLVVTFMGSSTKLLYIEPD